MHSKLAQVLIDRGVIQRGTVLEVYHTVTGLSGKYDTAVLTDFELIGAKTTEDWVYFIAADPKKQQRTIRCDYVVALDGMPLSRVAASQMLTEDGEPTSKRRLRKRKGALNV